MTDSVFLGGLLLCFGKIALQYLYLITYTGNISNMVKHGLWQFNMLLNLHYTLMEWWEISPQQSIKVQFKYNSLYKTNILSKFYNGKWQSCWYCDFKLTRLCFYCTIRYILSKKRRTYPFQSQWSKPPGHQNYDIPHWMQAHHPTTIKAV